MNLNINIDSLLLIDRQRVRALQKRIRHATDKRQNTDELKSRLEHLVESAVRRKAKRDSAKLHIGYPKDLPITSRIDEIKKAISENQIVIISGSTGSGKTTQLPKILYECGYGRAGRIGCTQPRRLAATGMSKRVAEEAGCRFGGEVGCQVRFYDNTSDETVIKFMTDGILLAETGGDKLLLQYDAIIIDEAHERSLNIDFVLGYLKNILPSRPELKLIISSATLNTAAFSQFFDNAPVIEIEGRMYPIEDIFMPPLDDQEELSSQILRAVDSLNEIDNEGDVLVFLPGEKEIRDAADFLSGRAFRNTEILPLYGRLGINEQQRVFQTGGLRRIILATNVAETSITIPGIHFVIDSGLVRINRYDPRYRIQSLQVEQVSQASSRQRRGRCGRVREGVCIYLYDRKTLEDAPEYTDPEICRTSLAEVILQMLILNLPPIDDFPLIDMPKGVLIREGYKTLYEIGAIDSEYRLTEEGRLIAGFPIDPRLAKMICRGHVEKSLNEMVITASFLSMQDPRERPSENQGAADTAHKQWFDEDSDFISILKLWNFINAEKNSGASNSRIRKLCKDNFLNHRRVKEWQNLYSELIEIADDLKWKYNTSHTLNERYDYASIHRAVISAFPTNVGMKTETSLYQGPGDIKFNLFPGSNIFKALPPWIVCFSLVETTKLYARIAGKILPEWIESASPHLCKFVYKNVHWQEKRGFVSALETVVFRSLLVHKGRNVHYGRVQPAEAREIFIRDGIVPGNLITRDKWLAGHRLMLEHIRLMEAKLRRPDSLLNFEAIYRHFHRLLPYDVCSVEALESWLAKTGRDMAMDISEAVYPLANPVSWETDFPDELVFGRQSFKLEYKFDPGEGGDGVMMLCPSERLGILPCWACDWLVPGWLPDKISHLVRSLPKEKRILCNPLQEAVDEFMGKVKSGAISKNQYLLTALSAFLTARAGERIAVDDFDYNVIPAYLKMKVGLINDQGTVSVTIGMPDREDISSKLEYADTADQGLSATGLHGWPDTSIPDEVDIAGDGNLKGYPALVDEEKSVGLQVFTDKREAEIRHRQGTVRLFRLQYKEQCAYLEKQLPLSRNTVLSLSCIYGSDRYKKDIADTVIWMALTDNDRLSLKNAECFHVKSLEALGNMHRTVKEITSSLEQMLLDRDKVNGQMLKLSAYKESVSDIRVQLGYLFRPGFLSLQNSCGRYPVYMKALLLRIERLMNSPQKDLEKLSQVAKFQEQLDERLASLKKPELAFGTMDFARLLQEYRVKVFAPEIPLPVKVSPKIMEQAWADAAGDRLKG